MKAWCGCGRAARFGISVSLAVLILCPALAGPKGWGQRPAAGAGGAGKASVLCQVAACVDPPDYAVAVQVVGTYAYVADATAGLRVFDVSNPTAPVQVGFCGAPENAQAVEVVGNYAYVANGYGTNGFWVIDVSNPAAPSPAAYLNTPGYCVSLCLSDNHAYVAAFSSGLRIIDVAVPWQPVEVAHVPTAGTYVYDVDVADGVAYVGAGDAGLRIIDVSIPQMPSSMGFVDFPGIVKEVSVSGNYVYAAEGDFRVIDVSNPWAPQAVGFCDIPSNMAQALHVSGQYAYVADGDIRVVDITDPEAPFEVTSYQTPFSNWATGLNAAGGYIYVAEGDHGGLTVYSLWQNVPALDIQVNGQDASAVVPPNTACSVTVSMDPDAFEGFFADWWIAVRTPFDPPWDWYTYVHPDRWIPGIHCCIQAPLFAFSGVEIMNRNLPPGDYAFFFAVDPPDGTPTAEIMDWVEVTVQQAPAPAARN